MKSRSLLYVNLWQLKSLQATCVPYFNTFLQNLLHFFFILLSTLLAYCKELKIICKLQVILVLFLLSKSNNRSIIFWQSQMVLTNIYLKRNDIEP
jgi:hypothetical protein